MHHFLISFSKMLSENESAGAEVTSTMKENVDYYITKSTQTTLMLAGGGNQPESQEPLGSAHICH